MKYLHFICIVIALFALSSCEKNDKADPSFKLTGTCWAYESTYTVYNKVNYSYGVWYFTSEKEGTYTSYYTYYNQVDIGHGDDPMKYGAAEGHGKLYVKSFNFPDICVLEKREHQFVPDDVNTNIWDGTFISEDFLIVKTGVRTIKFLRVYRKTL